MGVMESNIRNGSLDGGYIPPHDKEYFMLTRYDSEHNPSSEVYWWQDDIGCWVYQPTATAAAMRGIVEQHTATTE